MKRILLATAVVTGLLAVSSPPVAAGPVKAIDQPASVAVDDNGNVFVADDSNGFISKFAPDGRLLASFGGLGFWPGQLGERVVLAVSRTGDVYATNPDYNRVEQFTNDGAFVRNWGAAGPGNGQFYFDGKPAGIAVDTNGQVFVADPGNSRVQKFSPDGQFLGAWGSPGWSDPGQLSFPTGIAIDSAGSVYVADSGNSRIQKFSNDGAFQSIITRPDGRTSPVGLAVGPSGMLSVSTGIAKRIDQYRPDGTFLRQWTPGVVNPQNFYRSFPGIDSSGNLYVPDNVAGQVLKLDENGNLLETFTSTGLKLKIATGKLPRGQAGQPYAVSLIATGGAAPYTWRIASGALPSGHSLSAHGQISGTTAKAMQTQIGVEVTDSNGQTATRQFALYVEPFIATGSQLPSATLGKAYSATLKATGGAGYGYKWSITGGALPTGLKLAANGVIAGTPTTHGNFDFTASVNDAGKPINTATRQFSLTVTPMTITTASIPAGLVGKAYPSTTLKVSGGRGGYKWTVATGSLPSGLKLSAAGALSGTPTHSGDFTFTARVTDASVPANIAERQFTLAITPMTILTASLPNGTVKKTYSSTLFKASGGKGTLTWSIDTGTLPTGLKLAAGGYLSGTPTTAGTYSFTVRLTDSSVPKNTATKAFTITVI